VFSRIPLASIGRFALILLCLGLLLLLVAFVLPISFDLSPIKGKVEEVLTGFLEAPVTLEGVQCRLSLWPTVQLAGVSIVGSGHEQAPQFAAIEHLEIKLSLLPLLRKRLKLQKIAADDLEFQVHRRQGTPGNWPVWTTMTWEIVELSGIDVQNVSVNIDDPELGRHTLVIDSLTAAISQTGPLDLDLEGSFDSIPLSVSLGGPTLAHLAQKASDFPLAGRFELSDLQIEIDGEVSREPAGTDLELSFAVQSANLDFVRELSELDAAAGGNFELTGALSKKAANVSVTELRGSLGSSSVRGSVALDTASAPPRLTGGLAIDQVDVTAWSGSQSTGKGNGQELPFQLLTMLDAELEITLGELLGLGVSISDASASILLTDGALEIPLSWQTEGIAIKSDLRADATEKEVSAKTHIEDLTLDQMRALVEVADNLDGRIGEVQMVAHASGENLETLEAGLVVDVLIEAATFTIGGDEDDPPVELILDRASFLLRPAQPLTASLEGILLEESFAVNLETSPLQDLIDKSIWPLKITGQGAGSRIDIDGTIDGSNNALDLDFKFSGDRIGELDSWLGVSEDAALPFLLAGRLQAAEGQRELRLGDSMIGQTRFGGAFVWSSFDEDQPFDIGLHATTLDLAELQLLFEPVTELNTESDTLGIDLPIVPTQVRFHDADIQLTVDRLLRETLDLKDIQATFSFRDGTLDRSPFSFTYDESTFAGEIVLDMREEIPSFGLSLTGAAEELGGFLEQEEIFDESHVTASRLDLQLTAAGKSLRRIIRSADVTGQLVDVRWRLTLPESGEIVEIRLDRVELSGPSAQPIVLTASGLFDQEPIGLRLELRLPEEPGSPADTTLPFGLEIDIAGAKLELEGEFLLPLARHEIDMDMIVTGESLATLSSLLDKELPAIGPYRLEGQLFLGNGEYRLQDFDLALGESGLQGEIRYQRVNDRPTFTAELTSSLIRTIDILPPRTETDSSDEESPEPPQKTKLTLSHLNGFDAAIDLHVQVIETVEGNLENLTLDVDLESGRFDLLTTRPQPEGGDAKLDAKIRPWGEGVEAEVVAHWNRQPYGLFADLLGPGTAKGSWSLGLDLQSRGSTLPELLSNLNGYIGITDYPVDFDATIFDLWGGGLLQSLLPMFRLGSESRVNCNVGWFQVEEGVMKPDTLIVDSSRSRVFGKGTIDLPADQIKLRLKPRPKHRNLINLATPVDIRGSLADPNVRISKGGTALTFFRISLWVYTVWRDIVRTPLPTDGSDVCVDPPR